MIVIVSSTDLSLKAYDTPHLHPVVSMQLPTSNWTMPKKKGIGQKWEQLLLTQPMLKTDISSHRLRQFFAVVMLNWSTSYKHCQQSKNMLSIVPCTAKQLSEAKCIIIIIVPSQITSSSQKGWPIHDSPPSRPTLTTRFAKWWLSAVTPTNGISFHEWPVPTVDQQALFSSVQQVRSKMVAPKRTRRAKEMLCSWPSLPRRFRSDHPGTWKLWQRSKAQGGSIEIVHNSRKNVVWFWYEMIWHGMAWYKMKWYDMLWRDMIRNCKQCVYTICLYNKQNEKYRIWKYHVFVHDSKALYQLYNLCMSHHETIHAQHILQPLIGKHMCKL